MTDSSRWISLLSQLKIAQRVADCLVVFLTLVFSSAIAKCDDDSPSGETSQKSEMSSTDPLVFPRTLDATAMKSRLAVLNNTVAILVKSGDIMVAVEVQRQVISILDILFGKTHWQTKIGQVCLAELEHVSELPKKQQETYFAAYRTLFDSQRTFVRKDYGSTEELLNKALAGFSTSIGEDFTSVGATLSRLGIVNMENKNPSRAMEYFVRAAAVWKVILGEDHPNYKETLSYIGAAYLETKGGEKGVNIEGDKEGGDVK